MAMFRLEATILSREKRGKSVIAAAAYRAGTKLKDERNGNVYDYSRRVKGVVDTTILAPEGAPGWAHDSGRLWNAVEAGEKRVDAQLARQFILAVPPELSVEAQFATARDWAQKELVGRGMIAEVSLHHSRTGRNPHVHILCTMRRLDGEKFSARKPREWNDVGLLRQQRESWAAAVNAALEAAGRPERVDHRSLKDQGVDRIPEPKRGIEATAMERRGAVEDTRRSEEIRHVKLLNDVRPMAKAIRKGGEVKQHGMGKTWWEKSIVFVGRLHQRAGHWLKKGWRKLVDSGRAKGESSEPHLER